MNFETDLQDLHRVRWLNDEEKRAIETVCKAEMERGGDIDVAGVTAAFIQRRNEREGQRRRDEEQRRRAMEERSQEIEWKRRWERRLRPSPPPPPVESLPTGLGGLLDLPGGEQFGKNPAEVAAAQERRERIKGMEGGD